MKMKDSALQMLIVQWGVFLVLACATQVILNDRTDYYGVTIPILFGTVIGVTGGYCSKFGVSKNKIIVGLVMICMPIISMFMKQIVDVAVLALYAVFAVIAAAIGLAVVYAAIKLSKPLTEKLSAEMKKEYDRQKQIKIEGAALDAKGIMHCPKCNSTQLTANPRGYSAGKAITGYALFGVGGLVAGAIGNSKIKITCLSCGHEFSIKKK